MALSISLDSKAGRSDRLSSAMNTLRQTCRGALLSAFSLSAVSNVLMLTSSFFMLQIYDRVLTSRSIPTLVGLSIIAALLFVAHGIIDLVRSRLLVRVGRSIDQSLQQHVYQVIVDQPIRNVNGGAGLAPLRYLDNIRAFVSGIGPPALFDLLWILPYLGVLYLFHPLLAYTAMVGAIVLVSLTLLAAILTAKPTKAAGETGLKRYVLAEASRRNADVLAAMNMSRPLGSRWSAINDLHMDEQQRLGDVQNGIGAVSKIFRLLLQSGMLAVGAYLVLRQEATAGIIIAGAILSGRALAPVDQVIANWKGLVEAYRSWCELRGLIQNTPSNIIRMRHDAPHRSLTVESLTVTPPGLKRPVVSGVSFTVHAGQAVAIIGDSASGKTSLVRALVGVWTPAEGKVCIDGTPLGQWSSDERGRYIGYLPQDVGLMGGSVRENISRFDESANDNAVRNAARSASVENLIENRLEGFETDIGDYGSSLSAGQRQRIGLARALYGNPFLVCLDEPNSNLDEEGQLALVQAIHGIKARGGIVVVVDHRRTTLSAIDLVLALNQDGTCGDFGPRDDVISKRPPRRLFVVATAPAPEARST